MFGSSWDPVLLPHWWKVSASHYSPVVPVICGQILPEVFPARSKRLVRFFILFTHLWHELA